MSSRLPCLSYPVCAQIREKEQTAAGAMGDEGLRGLSSGITPKVQEVYAEIGASSLLLLLVVVCCTASEGCAVEVV